MKALMNLPCKLTCKIRLSRQVDHSRILRGGARFEHFRADS